MDASASGLPPAAALRLRLAQDAARLGYWEYEVATQQVIWDDACAAVFGIPLEEFDGTFHGFARRCHPDDLERVRAVLGATGPGEALEVAYRAVQPDGAVRHVLSRGQALTGPDGAVERLVGVVLDITELAVAVEGEQRAAARLAGLASVALALAGAHDRHELARVVIDRGAAVLGADGGAVCVRDDERGVIRLAMTESLGEDVQQGYAELPLDGPLPGSYTARTGEAVFLPDRDAGLAFTPAMQLVHDGTDRDAWAVLPLRSAGRLLGSLVVSWAQPREFPEEERELLHAFAAQTAQALERIQALEAERRQAHEARRLAETLQRSLLTSPPQPPDVQIAVRYAAAAQEAAVGGDWYDAFHVPDGALALVIGDCVGHDRQAAAAMATMRNMLRATAYAVAEPPAAVLGALDVALHGLDVGVLATALLGRLETDDAGRRLVWSSAGHLPPLLVHPDGRAELLTSPPGLLLGLSHAAERTDTTVPLPDGATLLLFTDGLVERRGEDLDDGLERLRALTEELAQHPLEDLCDALLGALLDEDSEDDVALLAVRVAGTREAVPGREQETRRSAAQGPAETEVRVPGGTALVERSTALPAEPRSASAARRFVTRLLDETGRPDWRESAELAVSEIVTNAVLHAHTPLVLTARVDQDRLRVEVRDENPALPSLRQYDEQATTGRGMALVAAVTSAHGVTPLAGDGKVVWFTVGSPAAELDVDALLDAWGDDGAGAETVEAPGARHVRLVGLPPTLWLAARQHHDALLRELALHRAGKGAPTDDLAAADRARTTISSAVVSGVAEARDKGDAQRPLPSAHPSPLDAVPATLDLELSVEPSRSREFAVLQDVLDEAERLATHDELLARPGLPEIIAVRDWACEQVIAQLGGTDASAWQGTDAERFTTLVHDDGPRVLDWDASEVAGSARGVVAADDANRILAVSRPLADALGWPVEELVGRRVVAIVPRRFREAHVAGFTRHLTTGEAHVLGVDLDLPVLRADGTELPCRFYIEATGTPSGRTVYLAWITPIGD